MEFLLLFFLLFAAYAARKDGAVNGFDDGRVPYYSLSLRSRDSLDRD